MCGIVGYIGPKRVVPLILDGLKRLEYRGYDSAGIAVVGDNGKLEIRRAPGKLRNLEESIRATPLDGVYGIGHTRWATHGRPTEENAHPHRDCTGEIVVVHNGIIENYIDLKKQPGRRGPQVRHRNRHGNHRPSDREIFEGRAARGSSAQSRQGDEREPTPWSPSRRRIRIRSSRRDWDLPSSSASAMANSSSRAISRQSSRTRAAFSFSATAKSPFSRRRA